VPSLLAVCFVSFAVSFVVSLLLCTFALCVAAAAAAAAAAAVLLLLPFAFFLTLLFFTLPD
jgi:hypothetical protein